MKTRSLVMDVRVGESVSVDGGRVVVRVGEKSGQG
jgi:pyruvate kinase